MHDDVFRSTTTTAAATVATLSADDADASVRSRLTTAELCALQSTLWLFVGAVAGLLLATLLLAPSLGEAMAPVTYGRLVPVHFNTQLYGWLSLPLVGLLLRFYFPTGTSRLPSIAILAWSGGLSWGVATWIAGHSSGKLFLEWTGSARVVMTLAMTVLWIVIAAGLVLYRQSTPRAVMAWKTALAVILAPVPWVMWHATSVSVYPPINPDSGGATGGSLLGSTLGIIGVILVVPFLAGRSVKAGSRHVVGLIVAALFVHSAMFGLLDHGDRSHHEVTQILAILSLFIWIPLLIRFFRSFEWDDVTWLWLRSLLTWGALLWTTASITFMPGVLERMKFTNGLVAHAHLAMAGFTTSLIVIVLSVLTRGTRLEVVFADEDAFRDWHLGLALMIVSLTAVGILESEQRGILFTHDPIVTTLYLIRWIAGFLMTLAAFRWLATSVRRLTPEESA